MVLFSPKASSLPSSFTTLPYRLLATEMLGKLIYVLEYPNLATSSKHAEQRCNPPSSTHRQSPTEQSQGSSRIVQPSELSPSATVRWAVELALPWNFFSRA